MSKIKKDRTSDRLEKALSTEAKRQSKYKKSKAIRTIRRLREEGILSKPTYKLPLKDTIGKFSSSEKVSLVN